MTACKFKFLGNLGSEYQHLLFVYKKFVKDSNR